MAIDFYISYSGTSQADGKWTHLLKEPLRERVQALTLLLHQLLQSNTSPGENQRCPICGQRMKLSFEYYIEIPKELDITTECIQCNIGVFFKSNRIPPWARAVSLLDGPGFLDRSIK
jgi:hypothetical protein